MNSGRVWLGIRWLLACSVVLTARPAPAQCLAKANWQQLILDHRGRYPKMGFADAFKLLQQATMGSEHVVGTAAEASTWMDREWVTLGDGPPEPLVDTLGPGGRFARINLRPYRAAGGKPAPLVAAFVETAQKSSHDAAALSCAIDAIISMAQAHEVLWPVDSVLLQAAEWQGRGYPAIGHTTAYEREYRPAYRVVDVRLVTKLLAGIEQRR